MQLRPGERRARRPRRSRSTPTRPDVTVDAHRAPAPRPQLARAPGTPRLRPARHRRRPDRPRRPRRSRTPAPSPSRSPRSPSAAAEPGQFARATGEPGGLRRRHARSPQAQSCDLRVQFDPATHGREDRQRSRVALQRPGHRRRPAHRHRHPDRSSQRAPDALAFGPRDIDDGATDRADLDGHQQRHRAGHAHRDRADRQRARASSRATPAERRDCTATTLGGRRDLRRCVRASTRRPPATKTATLTVSLQRRRRHRHAHGHRHADASSRAAPATLAFGARGHRRRRDGRRRRRRVTNSGTEPVTLTAITLAAGDASAVRPADTGAAGDCTATHDARRRRDVRRCAPQLRPGVRPGDKTATITVVLAAPPTSPWR